MTTSTTCPPPDATGIILWTLCFLHCLAVPFIATGALAWAASKAIHVGLATALAGVVILEAWPSYQQHRYAIVPTLLVSGLALLIVAVLTEDVLGEYTETSLTALGSVVLLFGHVLNLRLRRTCV